MFIEHLQFRTGLCASSMWVRDKFAQFMMVCVCECECVSVCLCVSLCVSVCLCVCASKG